MAIINGYKLIEPPYQGGMALVYKGKKGEFARAFKMVRPDKAANNPRLCQQFLKEIQLQTKLEHPNIIKILDAYPYTNEKGFTVTVLEMEWLNGTDLQRCVEERAKSGLDSKTVIKIAHSIIDGLEYAHKKNILHLDIKPSNIFLTDDGYIKIIDFGIARVVGENADIVEGATRLTVTGETGESTFRGTLAYASPEQQVGARLGLMSDIYSFGKTLHFLSTGTTDPSAEIKNPLLAKIVAKCTTQSPVRRYQTFGEVRNALYDDTNEKNCPKCHSVIGTNAKFCPQCGTSLNEPETQEEICPRCKKKREHGNNFCDNCGWNFANEQTPKKHTSSKIIIGYQCSNCKRTTGPYIDGKINFCNYCGKPKTYLNPVYK